jgi:LDH2 family malate/lactate/ureidoglycolate dehydrogenase
MNMAKKLGKHAINTTPDSFVRVQENRLLDFSIKCFETSGIDTEHATLISRLLVNSDLRGIRSHGTRAMNEYCHAFEQGHHNSAPDVKVIHETPTSVVVDGDGTLGYLPMARATEGAIAKAKEVGIGMGLARNMGHYGSAGHYARMCMEAGYIGFSVQGYRGTGNAADQETKPQLGYWGNPPMCFAIPAGKEPAMVLDSGTYILTGIPSSPETDELMEKYPVLFFRSIGFCAVSNLLAVGLAGAALPETEENAKWPGNGLGGMVLAINVGSVISEDAFLGEADRLARDLRETHEPIPGTDEALLPGAIEEQRVEVHRREGIRYGPEEQAESRKASERLGVPLPWEE